MIHEARKRLRELVRDYYHGLLPVDTYRSQRGEIIDAMDSGVDMEDTLGSPTRPRERGADRRQTKRYVAGRRASDLDDTPEMESEKAGSSSPLTVMAMVSLAAAAVAAWYFWPEGGLSVMPDTTTANEDSEPGSPRNDVREFVGSLAQQADFPEDSMNELTRRWHGLSEAERREIRSTLWFKDFADEVRGRIEVRRALNPGAADGPIETFARHLGIVELSGSTPVVAKAAESARQPAPRAVSRAPEPAPVRAAPQPVRQPSPAAAAPRETSDAPEQPAPVEIPVSPPPNTNSGTGDVAASPTRSSRPDIRAPPEESPAATLVETVEQQPATPSTGDGAGKAAPASDGGCSAELAALRRPFCRDDLGDGSEGPVMVVVRPGTFQMGSEWRSEEGPAHQVAIAAPFAISRYEIFQSEYRRFCASTGYTCPASAWSDDDYPMVGITWDEAQRYVAWLSASTGQIYRLPTEAEWEYAARGGTDTHYPFGDDLEPHHAQFSGGKPLDRPMPRSGSINPNGFRLYHMAGNVREWILDDWVDDYSGAPGDGSARSVPGSQMKVVRGGSYADSAARLRSAAREPAEADGKDAYTGIRVVREIAVPGS